MNTLSKFLVVTIAVSSFLIAFRQQGIESSLTNPLLKPGDQIDDMTLTTGAENAYPLWSICSSQRVNDHSIRGDCRELSFYANLAIGHTLGVMDLVDHSIDWEELIWEMSVDGHPIDLEAFGIYDFVHPDIPPRPSPVREVFRVVSVWDVVLVNPTPGTHRLQGQAQSPDGAETYTWVVDFTVPDPSQPTLAQSPRQSDARYQMHHRRIH